MVSSSSCHLSSSSPAGLPPRGRAQERMWGQNLLASNRRTVSIEWKTEGGQWEWERQPSKAVRGSGVSPGEPFPFTVDPNKERCEAVKLKITKYLQRAEEIFNCHLQKTLGSRASPGTVRRPSPRA